MGVIEPPRIFISYRRAEPDRTYAGRIRGLLANEFGSERVFYDIDSISPGVDFRDAIRERLEASSILVALIGPRWRSKDMFDHQNWVRSEIVMAIELDKPILPILLANRRMPEPETLPTEMSALAYLNAALVRPDPDFDPDVQKVVAAIRRLGTEQAPVTEGSTAPAALSTAARRSPLVIRRAATSSPDETAGDTTTQDDDSEFDTGPLTLLVEAALEGHRLSLDYTWYHGGRLRRRSRLVELGVAAEMLDLYPPSPALTSYLLPIELRDDLLRADDVRIETNDLAGRIPWEYIGSGTDPRLGVAVRQKFWRDSSATTTAPGPDKVDGRRAIVIGNPPLGNAYPKLEGAMKEATAVADALESRGYEVSRLIWGADDSADVAMQSPERAIVESLMSGPWTICHISGHGVVTPSGGEIPIAADTRLPISFFEEMEHPPALLFLSAQCAAGSLNHPDWASPQNFAARMIDRGTKAIVLPQRAVGDDAAVTFAVSLYACLLNGEDLATAILIARRACQEHRDLTHTWGSFVAFGDRRFRLPAGDTLEIRAASALQTAPE